MTGRQAHQVSSSGVYILMQRREWLERSYSYLLNWNARCPGGFNRGTACGCAFFAIQEFGANLDEEALGEHVTVAPSLARSLNHVAILS